jgi:hypothetical protein
MSTLRFPTGLRSARSSTRVPGRSTGKGYIGFMVDPKSLAATTRALEALAPKIRKKVAAKGLRKWGQAVRKAARAAAYRNAERTKRQLTYKIRPYKTAVWCGVGVKTDKVRNPNERGRIGRNSPFVGWKSHFYEVGWTAFPKGVGGNAERAKEIVRNEQIRAGRGAVREITVYRNGRAHVRKIRERERTLSAGASANGGRGWRKGVRGRKGVFQSQYARHYIWKAAQYGRANAARIIGESVAESVREIQRGMAA